jgi:hypothetical protein
VLFSFPYFTYFHDFSRVSRSARETAVNPLKSERSFFYTTLSSDFGTLIGVIGHLFFFSANKKNRGMQPFRSAPSIF